MYSKDNPKAYDNDFQTFAECQIVPHGIYDISRNVGYISIGTSHDTSEFVCDNIERVWNEHLISEYPNAETLIILCDGGGSNSSSHHIVKQDLMSLSLKLNLKILVMHYPPYCSKHNPIEHRLFSQISRSWNGEPLLSIDNAVERAKKTTTSKGLFVHVAVNSGVYPIKRKVTDDYKTLVKHRIVFHKTLPKWNYLIKTG
ncbi:MAG: ISAzo13 family transposase [Paludibacteraceae bacterium]|nr:ISAzo13 family transposase [Paludibacteraceae bacterium]